MIYKIIFFTLLAVGTAVVVGSTIVAIKTVPATQSGPDIVLAPSSSPSPATVKTLAETPADKLKRVQHFVESRPLSQDLLDAAKRTLTYIPKSTAEYKEGQRLIRGAEVRLSAERAAEALRLREMLQAEYEVLLSDANPHLNYIKTALSKHKGGFVLWGVHDYFSRYTFSIGDDAKVVSAWIARNRSHLEKAGIVRVGVQSQEGWGGSCWFDI